MNNLLRSKKGLLSLAVLALLILGIPIGVYLSQRQQNITPNAASSTDLIVDSFQLTDAGGNVKTTFAVNEDIYVLIKLKNQGGSTGISTDGTTHTQIYGDKSMPVATNTLSDVNMEMSNGEFGANSLYSYSSIYTSGNKAHFIKAKAWKKSSAGSYKATAFINFNKFVTESNYANNQVQVNYTVTTTGKYTLGTTSATVPTGFSSLECVADENNFEPNLRACVTAGATGGKTFAKVTNLSSTQTYPVGLAAYQAYLPYPPGPYPTCSETACPDQYKWIWTQTIYSAITYSLPPGKTIYLIVNAPSCAWQTDVFKGSIIPSFTLPDQWYTGKKTYLDGYYNTKLNVCQPVIPSPTPTPTVNPSATPTPIPSNTPTPTPTLIPTPTPTIPGVPTHTPTPTPTACPTPSAVQNVRITCPNCSLTPTPEQGT